MPHSDPDPTSALLIFNNPSLYSGLPVMLQTLARLQPSGKGPFLVHELGITQSIIDIAGRNAAAQGATRVLSVTVEIGLLAGVVPEALEFCYEACAAGTLLDGSRLILRIIPGRGRCSTCGSECPLEPCTFACPACGALTLERLAGEELRVLELEIP